MAVSYNKLWKLLVDKKMSKADLRRAADLSPNTMTKLRRDEPVAMIVLEKICSAIDVDFGDIIQYVAEDKQQQIRFTAENVPEIVALANQLAALLEDSETAEFEFEIYAIPDGEGDYDFASVAIEASGSAVKDTYCRF